MYETYPKSGNRMLGEQKSVKFAPGSAKPEYNRVGSKDRYPDKSGTTGPMSRRTSKQQNRSPWLTGGGNKQVSATYPAKAHGSFKSEQVANKLVPPMSRKPKQA